MAQLHNELRRIGNLLRGFKRAFALDEADGVERLGETLTPTMDLWSRPEWLYLQGWRSGVVLIEQAAVLGEFGYVAILNPTDSGRLVVIDRADPTGTGAGPIHIIRLTAAQVAATLAQVPGTSGPWARDTRWPFDATLAQTSAQCWWGSDASSSLGPLVDRVADYLLPGRFPLVRGFVLSPGFALAQVMATVNTALYAGWSWWERTALKDELV